MPPDATALTMRAARYSVNCAANSLYDVYLTWTESSGENENRPINCLNLVPGVRLLHLGRRATADRG